MPPSEVFRSLGRWRSGRQLSGVGSFAGHRASSAAPHRRRLVAREANGARRRSTRHSVPSSLRSDIRSLRSEKTGRRPSRADKMTGQAKNLHGGSRNSGFSTPNLRGPPSLINSAQICLRQDIPSRKLGTTRSNNARSLASNPRNNCLFSLVNRRYACSNLIFPTI